MQVCSEHVQPNAAVLDLAGKFQDNRITTPNSIRGRVRRRGAVFRSRHQDPTPGSARPLSTVGSLRSAGKMLPLADPPNPLTPRHLLAELQ